MKTMTVTSAVSVLVALGGMAAGAPAAAAAPAPAPALAPWCSDSSGYRLNDVAPAAASVSDVTDLNVGGMAVGTSDVGAFTSLWGARGSRLTPVSVAGTPATVMGPRISSLGSVVATATSTDSAGIQSGAVIRWAWAGATPKTTSVTWSGPVSGRGRTVNVLGVTWSGVALLEERTSGTISGLSLLTTKDVRSPIHTGSSMSSAFDISEDGMVVGAGALGDSSVPATHTRSGAWTWRAGQPTYLPKLDPAAGGYDESAMGVSMWGSVVSGRSSSLPVWWDRDRVAHDMNGAPAAFMPAHINDCRVALGTTYVPGSGMEIGVWRSGAYVTLDSLVSNMPQGWRVCAVAALTEMGQVGASICPTDRADTRRRAVVLTQTL